MSKKNSPKLSPEAAAEQRRLSLAALTAGVSTVNMLGLDLPMPLTVAAPMSEPETAGSAAPVPAVEASGPAAGRPTPAPQPTAEPAPAPVAVVASPAIIPVSVAAQPVTEVTTAEDARDLPVPETAAQQLTEPAALDLPGLFVPSAEKKGATLRITADHQQFFAQMGFLLGGGASAPDIIHNILTRFRTTYDAQVQKALQKQMRQMLKKS